MDVIESGGDWISSVELESHLMRHPEVVEAAVIGVPDELWGEQPLAVVVAWADSPVTAVALRDFLADKVPRWRLPERWCFVREVPKTSIGTFDRTALRRRHAGGDLDVRLLS
jgi:fatty-acyl-CoA synthase